MAEERGATVYSYRIDGNDRIVSVSDGWDAFAAANDGAGAMAGIVVGSDLFAAIRDPETRHLYRSILGLVRNGQGPVRCTFRCDSPATKRLFSMEVASDGDHVLFTNTLLAHEAAGSQIVLEDLRERMREIVSMCVYCQGIRARGKSWQPLVEALRDLRLLEARLLPRLSHGICPACAARAAADGELAS